MTTMADDRSSRWIPWIFVLGFAVIIAVNATLIAFAIESFSGLVVEHPYRKGVEYSQTQEMLDRQRQLGWEYELRAEPHADGDVNVAVAWHHDAAPLNDLQVSAEFIRPVENAAPLTVFLQHRGNGEYAASVRLPAAGLWDVRITAERREERFVAAERLVLR
ncbi:MAG TPA: FixH family protein [Ferrovibrio sp.]|uniref:FixH family protein n=1 Tax=Ferrovibrio sp. TaxID=1917215 RepID=UPI002B4B5AB0|nr:FixH family protein [Ferrovibrio sp.]HLT79088.1 FixH family protein [Ferrovibrio sp.]